MELFFQIDQCKTASAARNWTNSASETDATIFALSSNSILLLWLLVLASSVPSQFNANSKQPKLSCISAVWSKKQKSKKLDVWQNKPLGAMLKIKKKCFYNVSPTNFIFCIFKFWWVWALNSKKRRNICSKIQCTVKIQRTKNSCILIVNWDMYEYHKIPTDLNSGRRKFLNKYWETTDLLDYPSLPRTVCGGKKLLLPLPFPIFDRVHIMQSMLLFPVLMNRIAFTGKWITGEENSSYLNSSLLLPSKWITGEENSCYLNSSLLGNLWY